LIWKEFKCHAFGEAAVLITMVPLRIS
jgi:hypothetical protein